MDVSNFRKVAVERNASKAWLKSKTKLIFDTYVRREAPMELNISASLVDATTRKFAEADASNAWTADFFVDVEKEMVQNLHFNLWYGFTKSGAYERALVGSSFEAAAGRGGEEGGGESSWWSSWMGGAWGSVVGWFDAVAEAAYLPTSTSRRHLDSVVPAKGAAGGGGDP